MARTYDMKHVLQYTLLTHASKYPLWYTCLFILCSKQDVVDDEKYTASEQVTLLCVMHNMHTILIYVYLCSPLSPHSIKDITHVHQGCGSYARALLDILFTKDEQMGKCVLHTPLNTGKPLLDQDHVHILVYPKHFCIWMLHP